MRILFLVSWFPSRVHPTHGNFVAKHARLVAKKHDVTVLHIQDDPALALGEIILESRLEDGYQLYQCCYGQQSNTAGWRKIWLRWRAWNRVQRAYAIDHNRPDCIHAHVLLDAGIFAAWLSLIWRIPFVITEHSTAYWTEGALSGLRACLGRWACRNAAQILPVTPALGQAMQAQGLAGKYGSVSNVVNEQLFEFRPARAKPLKFLHVSNFRDWHKNVSGLIRAFLEAEKKSTEEMTLLLAGDGDLEALKKMVITASVAQQDEISEKDDYRSINPSLNQRQGLALDSWPKSIQLKGRLTEEEVARLMQECHAFVLFSNVENQPVVLLEALCCGRPCIATDVGGVRDIINTSNGIIVPPKDEAKLTRAILALQEKYQQYELEQISLEAAGCYGSDGVLSAFEAVYQKAIEA